MVEITISRGAWINIASKTVTFDIGVRREFQKGKDLYIISDIGDLSQKSAYKTIDLQGKIIEERIRPATCADFLTKLISWFSYFFENTQIEHSILTALAEGLKTNLKNLTAFNKSWTYFY